MNVLIDERLIKRSKKIDNEKKEKKLEPYTNITDNSNFQIVYTINQLAKALPGISRYRVEELIAEGKIRTIPAGAFNSRYVVIPYITLLEDLQALVEKYNQ